MKIETSGGQQIGINEFKSGNNINQIKLSMVEEEKLNVPNKESHK